MFVHSVHQDNLSRMASIDYESIVDMDENDHRLELLNTKVRKHGTGPNTLALASTLVGHIGKTWVF